MKKAAIQKICITLLSVFTIIYCFVQVLASYSEELTYTQAITTSYEKTQDLTGYLLRDEKVITYQKQSPNSVVYIPIDEGTRMKKGELLGSVYADAEKKNIQQSILEISDKIEILENSEINTNFTISDVSKLDQDIYDLLYHSRQGVEANTLRSSVKNRRDLLLLLNKRQKLIKAVDSFDPLIKELTAQKTALEMTLKEELAQIYCPYAGYFSFDVDGWETILNTEALKDMTVESFLSTIEQEPLPQVDAIGKIFVDYCWYTLCPLDKSEAVDYTVGKTYDLEYPSTTNEIFHAVLDRMITQTDSDTVILVFSSNEISEEFRYTRKQSVRIIKERLEGLRINKEALRIVNGEQGVYVLLGNNLYFRKTEIIYASDDYYLVKQLKSSDSGYSSSLMLYDNVVIGGKNLYDGKVVN